MGAVPRESLGVASGLLALSRTLGQSIGVPIMGAFFITLVTRYRHMPPGQSLASTPPETLVAGITGTCFIAALIIFFFNRPGGLPPLDRESPQIQIS
jgi:hypothetical protein